MKLIKIKDVNRNELVKYARFRRLDMPDAEDVVQNTFLMFLQYYGDVEVEERLLFKILKNEINKFNRDKHTDGMFVGDSELSDIVEKSEEYDDLLSSYVKKNKNKEILSLYFAKGYKLAEISTLLRLNFHKVHRVIQRFKTYISEGVSDVA